MPEEMEVQLDFTDITIVEKDGIFKDIKEVMLSEFPHPDKWVLRTMVTIGSIQGIGEMDLQCHSDGSIYIMDYFPSMGDLYYNPDIMAIATWAREKGWEVPQPHVSLVKKNKVFWKHFYDTLVVDCDYFDKTYGKRPQLESGKDDKKENGN